MICFSPSAVPSEAYATQMAAEGGFTYLPSFTSTWLSLLLSTLLINSQQDRALQPSNYRCHQKKPLKQTQVKRALRNVSHLHTLLHPSPAKQLITPFTEALLPAQMPDACLNF